MVVLFTTTHKFSDVRLCLLRRVGQMCYYLNRIMKNDKKKREPEDSL